MSVYTLIDSRDGKEVKLEIPDFKVLTEEEYNKEKIKQQKKKYYLANKERIRSQQKEYKLSNKDKLRDYHSKYNKERYLAKKEKELEYYFVNRGDI